MMRPPLQCQQHRTRSSDRVVVLHDPTAVGCPSTTLAVASAMSVPFLGNGTAPEHRF